MRPKLLWIILAVSLTANVFLVAGALYTLYGKGGWHAKSYADVESIGDRLALTEEQRRGLSALRERAQERRQGMREQRRERRSSRRAAFLAELAKPTFDRDQVLALIGERAAERGGRFADMAGELHAYLATLTPPQREQFLAMARERGFLRSLFGRGRRSH